MRSAKEETPMQESTVSPAIELDSVTPEQTRPPWRSLAVWMWLRKSLFVVVAMFLFILALQLLKQGAKPLAPLLTNVLGIDSAANTLGFGWLVAYGVLSGSPVAAISLSF